MGKQQAAVIGAAAARRGYRRLAAALMAGAISLAGSACADQSERVPHRPSATVSAESSPRVTGRETDASTLINSAQPETLRPGLREFAFQDAPEKIGVADQYSMLRIDPLAPFSSRIFSSMKPRATPLGNAISMWSNHTFTRR